MLYRMLYRLRNAYTGPVPGLIRDMSYLTMLSDLESYMIYWRVCHGVGVSGTTGCVDVRIRQLNHRVVRIRTYGSDAEVVFTAYFLRYHVPPAVVPANALTIVDLGANIGCTMAHLAHLFPAATILGVEMDKENAALARFNTRPWSERCIVVEGAVWPTDGEIEYEYSGVDPYGYSAAERRPGHVTADTRVAPAYTMTTLCDRYFPGRDLDYVKMDVEGAEKSLFRENAEWTRRVRCLKVELHEYDRDECIADLNRLGFEASPDVYYSKAVLGIRRHG